MQAQGGEARPGKSGRADAQDSPSRVPPCLPHPSPLRPHRPDRSDIVDTRQPYQRKQQASPGKAGPVGRLPCATATIWDDLMESGFASVRHFTSLHTLEETGEAVRRRMMSSELDLNLFQRHTVEDQVSLIIQGMHSDRRLRQKFGLQGSVNFENHANTLSPEEQLEEDMEQLMVSGTGRRQSPRLQAKAKAKAKETRPSGSTVCVYNTGTTRSAQDRIAAFILEYKALHKLPLGYIYEGLGEMELDEVVQCRDDETLRDRFRRLVAAVITQAFSYMIRIGVEYGCVCTGEAYIFLHIGDDPRTVHYFLSVPKDDVGETTGWTAGSEGGNRLHLTAVGQMLAFTLQALKTPPRSQRWRAKAAAQLRSWEVVYDELLDAIPEGMTQSSEYQPPEDDSFLRMSPVQLRGGREK
ncbi:metalloprotease [Alternaria alternata]|nr:metalloprotease [Alternaria alternata]